MYNLEYAKLQDHEASLKDIWYIHISFILLMIGGVVEEAAVVEVDVGAIVVVCVFDDEVDVVDVFLSAVCNLYNQNTF